MFTHIGTHTSMDKQSGHEARRQLSIVLVVIVSKRVEIAWKEAQTGRRKAQKANQQQGSGILWLIVVQTEYYFVSLPTSPPYHPLLLLTSSSIACISCKNSSSLSSAAAMSSAPTCAAGCLLSSTCLPRGTEVGLLVTWRIRENRSSLSSSTSPPQQQKHEEKALDRHSPQLRPASLPSSSSSPRQHAQHRTAR
mmetsp:Transcript_46678/g.120359  ORF Transcript_46678/g.120359 Transcript_46678/m.120359 type:complete len:194 (-) Transcript_46678:222-803(-)